MKIALIDVGVSKTSIGNETKIRHFSLNNGEMVEKYKEPEEEHGTRCFKEIMANKKTSNIQILDLNISDESGTLQVFPVIAAIEKAIDERVDII